MLDVRIIDGDGKGTLGKVHKFKDNSDGLVVATRPYNYYNFRRYQFLSEEFGENLNIALTYGDPEHVHNGTDTTYWTYSTISGTAATPNRTTYAYDGTRSISWLNPSVGSTFQIAKGSTLNLTNYISLTMWVFITGNYVTGDSISVYAMNNTTQIGTKAFIEDYCNISLINTWQKVTIPLEVKGLTTQDITAIRFRVETRGGNRSPNIYFDVIEFEARGIVNPGTFTVAPAPNTWFFCKELRLNIAAIFNGANKNLDYKKFFTLDSLDSGINLVVRRRDIARYQINFKNIGDFINQGGKVEEYIYDGSSETFISLSLTFDYPILLQSEYQDHADISVNDDLSSLTYFKATARGGQENKIDTGMAEINVY